MKVGTAFVSALATVVVAQQQAAAQMNQPIPQMNQPLPQMGIPGPQMAQPQIPSMAGEGPTGPMSSFFDFSHISNMDTATPMSIIHVYEPETGKFTHLSMSVFRAGSMYYVPVCSIGATPDQVAAMDPSVCQSAIPLNPVPRNAAMTMIRMFSMLSGLGSSLMGQAMPFPANAMQPIPGGTTQQPAGAEVPQGVPPEAAATVVPQQTTPPTA